MNPPEMAEHHEPQPQPTLWPVGFAIGIAVLLVGLIIDPLWISTIGGAIALVFGALWALVVVVPLVLTAIYSFLTQGAIGPEWTLTTHAYETLSDFGRGETILRTFREGPVSLISAVRQSNQRRRRNGFQLQPAEAVNGLHRHHHQGHGLLPAQLHDYLPHRRDQIRDHLVRRPHPGTSVHLLDIPLPGFLFIVSR